MKISIRFFTWISISALCTLITYLLCAYYFADSIYSISYRNMVVKKQAAATKEKKPKILYNSGSNSLMGVRTKQMSEELGVPVYNLAINAGLGLEFVIAGTKKVVKKGDAVILPLEYGQLISNKKYHKNAFNYYRIYERDRAAEIPVSQRVGFLLEETPITMLLDAIDAWLIKTGIVVKPSGLNDHGDFINNIGQKESLLSKAEPTYFPPFEETKGLKQLKDFKAWCDQRGIALYYTYPAAMDFDAYKAKRVEDYFEKLKQYLKEANINVLGEVQESRYEKKYFYDTVYHLNTEGAQLRTKYLMKKMREANVGGMLNEDSRN